MSASTEKKIILVTGATNGIGLDTVILLVRDSPNNHVIMGARSESKAETKLKEIQAKNPKGSLSYVQLDVNEDSSIFAAAEKIQQEFGRIDVLVNNAGIYAGDTTAQWATREDLRATFETNVHGPVILTSACVDLLKASSDPRVINVSSGLGSISAYDADLDPSSSLHNFKAVRGLAYRLSKSALNMMSAYQNYQLKEFGVKAWAYCPGYVATDLTQDREARQKMGLESSETSAQGILEIVEGKRDDEAGEFVTKKGAKYPW